MADMDVYIYPLDDDSGDNELANDVYNAVVEACNQLVGETSISSKSVTLREPILSQIGGTCDDSLCIRCPDEYDQLANDLGCSTAAEMAQDDFECWATTWTEEEDGCHIFVLDDFTCGIADSPKQSSLSAFNRYHTAVVGGEYSGSDFRAAISIHEMLHTFIDLCDNDEDDRPQDDPTCPGTSSNPIWDDDEHDLGKTNSNHDTTPMAGGYQTGANHDAHGRCNDDYTFWSYTSTVTNCTKHSACKTYAADTDGSCSGSCYITTATVGYSDTRNELRQFRDDGMKSNFLGRAMVRAYYATAPQIASTLEAHPHSTEARLVYGLVHFSGKLAHRRNRAISGPKRTGLSVALTALYTIGLLSALSGHVTLTSKTRVKEIAWKINDRVRAVATAVSNAL